MKTILGLLVFFLPFITLVNNRDLVKNFLKLVLVTTLQGLLIFIFTLIFKGFYYWPILTIFFVINSCFLLYCFKFEHDFFIIKKVKLERIINFFKKNWILFIAIFIVGFQLFSIHHFYTGKILTYRGEIETKNSFIPQPYYSDEWVLTAFTRKSIEGAKMPQGNPLEQDESLGFPNIFVYFFSFVSGLILVFNLPLPYGIVILSLLTGLLISFIFYLFLRSSGVNKLISALGLLMMPLITVGSNSPGLGNLIPFVFGILFLLITLTGVNYKNNFIIILSSLLTLLFYPAFIIVIMPLLGLYYLSEKKYKRNNQGLIFFIGALIIIVLSFFIFNISEWKNLFEILKNSIWRLNPETAFEPRHPWFMIPVFILPFSVIGFFVLLRRRAFSIFMPIFIVFFLWAMYYFINSHFVILDVIRLAVLGSFFLIYLSCIGLLFLYDNFLKKYSNKIDNRAKNFLIIILLGFFLIYSLSYSSQENWQKLGFVIKDGDKKIFLKPAPPAVVFLHEDDLKIFKDLSGETFLSNPMKALVISAVSGAYALETKTSIISNNHYSFYDFISHDCEKKYYTAKYLNLSYVYSDAFNCPHFVFQDRSSEGINLYKIVY